jgi:phage terminase large subunit
MTEQEQINAAKAAGFWTPLPGPQTLACQLTMMTKKYREILFGGARGPGKTEWSIIVMAERIDNPRYQGLVLRKNADDLTDYCVRCEEMYQYASVVVRRNPMVLRFGVNALRAKGAMIRGGHLHDKTSYIKYQGQQFSRIAIEELTQIPSELLYKQIMSSCRSVYKELNPQMILTANPGGVGMGWVKRRFVEPIDKNQDEYTEETLENGDVKLESDRVIWYQKQYLWTDVKGVNRITVWNEIYDKIEETWRCFIPATIDTNPILTENDPNYVKMLEGLKTTDEALYNAWRHGDWSVFAGQVFTEFDRSKHVINNFADIGTTTEQFENAPKIISMDWGYSDDTAIYFTAYLDGRPVTYKEMVGNQKLASEWGKEIREYIETSGQRIDYFIYPSDMEDKKNGKSSPIDDIREELEKLPPSEQPSIQMIGREAGSRAIRQHATHKYLKADPCAKIFKSCANLTRVLPELVYDETRKEEIDVDTDHELTNPYDGWSYGLRWLMERRDSEIIHKSHRNDETPKGIMVGDTFADAGVDPAAMAIKASQEKNRDWRTL